MTIREEIEAREDLILSPQATKSSTAKRDREEAPDPLRTAFQRDRDRIIHSKCFRRLKHKTQVYIAPGDHYRTRMTHTLEVGQIGRTVARALRLNEDLVEAIAMGHDVGHTPFGHVGEYALRDLVGHFNHNEQSLRTLEVLEKDGQGLNLTKEVRDGILGHTGVHKPMTMEGQIIRLADRIAYLCHDFDDAQRAGMLSIEDLPSSVREVLGTTPSQMITTMVMDMVRESMDKTEIFMSDDVTNVMNEFRRFMFTAVYKAPTLIPDRNRAAHVVKYLFLHYLENPELLRHEIVRHGGDAERMITLTDIVDYVAGLTDQYAIKLFKEIYIPRIWDPAN
ncbi:deoxyguanosinetriphosphate triphosphohydrolase [Veillonella intestinalis]|uniref:deoxyguanosinetriphosphate triphosphohydrolase n=1 Tax=Veillonella intestinalis TaxID=2941341 RepID=UPI00203BC632|nr:deoxyguanosinetriphosphate triphosphohydrolase [Veillonella intestinalis]